ncbi:hypothetical protein FQR65_LT13212 [Abscondita terminalis]|nr:hypothetical protein FQR65_LT13212 [Abscondita terminalis]
MWFEITNKYVMLREKPPDYSRLINLTSFKFIILNHCDSAPFLLVLLHSAAENFERRRCIRETWGVERFDVRIFFMLGSVRTQKEQLQIEEENEKHRDIIQGSFLDTYRNLSYKHAMTLKYATYHCSQTKYVLKVDDDIFVNIPNLLPFLKIDIFAYGAKGRLLCLPSDNLVVARSHSKWATSFEEYNETHFPPFCLGFSTIYSPDVVLELYRVVQKSQYFWIDDVFVTGIVRSKTNITISRMYSTYLRRDAMYAIISKKIINIPFVFSPIELSVQEMYALNDAVNNVRTRNSNLFGILYRTMYVTTVKRCVYLLVLMALLIVWFKLINHYIIQMKTSPDYSRLINLTSFEFTILHRCDSAPILLVLLHTAANHFDRRKSIRETWGVKRADVNIFFMLGSVSTQKEQLQIEEENEIHKDIIQGSFLDSYRNLSYKHAMTLKYVTYHCSQTQYVLKVDDDIFVNIPTLLQYLRIDNFTYGPQGRMLCLPSRYLEVVRWTSKWKTSEEEYNQTHYPQFCVGFCAVYSPDVAIQLYREVQKTNFFWLEDVFVTGIVRSKTNITISSIELMCLRRNGMYSIISGQIKIPFIFSPIELTIEEMYALNKAVNNVTVK